MLGSLGNESSREEIADTEIQWVEWSRKFVATRANNVSFTPYKVFTGARHFHHINNQGSMAKWDNGEPALFLMFLLTHGNQFCRVHIHKGKYTDGLGI